MDKETETLPTKKLTLWEKVKAGVKGFFKTVAHYIPRGLIMAPIAVGVMMLVAPILPTGWVPAIGGVTDFVAAAIKTLVIGTALTGGIGAYQAIETANNERQAEMIAEAKQMEMLRGADVVREPEVENPEIAPQHGLPAAQAVVAHKPQGIQKPQTLTP